jgi:hypothetical protein
MRRFLAAAAVMAIIASMAPGTALAQEADPTGLTSLEPLTQIVEGFAAGHENNGLYLQGESDAGPTDLSQFQVIANLGGGQAFGDQDVEMVPSGLSADGDLVSLEEIFDGMPGTTSQLPPLAPFARGRAMDLTSVFEGWTAYDIQGLVEGPVEIREGVQVVAGIELAEPYNAECSEKTYVGRAWVGSTVSAPDPLFTAEALADQYAGTGHGALTGRASRLIELACFPGGGPVMVSSRMREGSGIRPFGPLEILGLVNGNHVVLIAPIRVLDADLTQRFYTSPPDGGDVVVSELEDEPRLLVPNPYGPNDIRIDLEIVPEPADTDAANPAGNAGGTATLLYREDAGTVLPIQSGGLCAALDDALYMLKVRHEIFGNSEVTFDPGAHTFGPATSSSGPVAVEDGKLIATNNSASGGTQTAVLDSDGTGTLSVARPGGVPCEVAVVASSNPNIFEVADDTSDGSGDGSTSDEGNDSGRVPSTDSDDEDPGGLPVALIVGLLVLLCGFGWWWWSRHNGSGDDSFPGTISDTRPDKVKDAKGGKKSPPLIGPRPPSRGAR